MLGESAMSLVKEAARNKGSLNPFNEDLVRQTIEETRRMWEQNRCVLTQCQPFTGLLINISTSKVFAQCQV